MNYTLLLLFFLYTQNLWSQIPALYPVSFIQFTEHYAFDNPAASSTHAFRDVKVTNSFYTGLLKQVGLYYLDASFKAGNKELPAHTPGIVVYSEYETELLTRTRVYLRYAWQTSLTPDLRLSAGASFGFFNYAVRGTNSSAGTSVFVPDGNIGLWLHGNSFNTGVSVNQFVGAEVKPLNRSFSMGRYTTVLADYRFRISHQVNLTMAVRIYAGEQQYHGAGLAATFLLAEHVLAGVLYHSNRGAGATIGIKALRVESVYGDLTFSYFQPTSSLNVLNSNRMEIMLHAYLQSPK